MEKNINRIIKKYVHRESEKIIRADLRDLLKEHKQYLLMKLKVKLFTKEVVHWNEHEDHRFTWEDIEEAFNDKSERMSIAEEMTLYAIQKEEEGKE